MRILAATPYYPPEGGGLERYAHETLRRLAGRGHDVEVHCFTSRPPQHGAEADGTARERHGRLRLRRHRPRLRAGNTPIAPGFAASLRHEIRRLRPDVVVTHTPVPVPAQAAASAARAEGVPYVVTYHAGTLRGSSPVLGVVAALDRWTLERRMLAGAAGLVAVTPYVRDHALRRQRGRVAIVPPGVDTVRFHPGPAPDPERPHVAFVGPLSTRYRWKGLDTLLAAWPLVRRAVPQATLDLVGDGDRQGELAELARTMPGLRRLGRVPDGRLAETYRASACLVLPSLTDAESFGMVLAEANACGRPVVASRIGGIPDFVRDGDNGLLARPGDAADLAARITALLRDPEGASDMGRRGRARVEREHDWDRIAAATEDVLVAAAR